jgi:hypothetical protein
MASPINAVLCALVGAAFWSAFGYAVARHLLPRVLALGAAPVIGWAVFSAASLPALTLIGFSAQAVAGLAAPALVIAAVLMLRAPDPTETGAQIGLRPWWVAAAAVLAVSAALALVPKYSADGVHLAAPIFDHSKIAIVDAMTRQGLPPVNPVFGESGAAGSAGHLVYYYLWHFSAAELALPLRASGWEADIGLTWFTAFASLTLMMALAVWLSQRASAAILVVALAASASLRALLGHVSGDDQLEPLLQASTSSQPQLSKVQLSSEASPLPARSSWRRRRYWQRSRPSNGSPPASASRRVRSRRSASPRRFFTTSLPRSAAIRARSRCILSRCSARWLRPPCGAGSTCRPIG